MKGDAENFEDLAETTVFLSYFKGSGANFGINATKRETVSKLGVLCGTTLLAARRLGESNVVLFECSVHNRRPHLEHEVCSSR